MINSHSLGKKPFETLYRVARYYLDKGLPKNKVRRMLDSFLIQCNPVASIPKWADTLDAAMSRAMKYDAIAIDYIEITKPEMKRIDALDGKQIRRLAFTLLCLSKYWDAINPNSNHWVNNKDSDIMRLANINTSIKRQSAMYYDLNQNGMIQFSKKIDNTSVRVLFAEDGETAMRVTDFRNLGYQYLRYHGEPYFECCNCGITTKYANPDKGRRQKYCSACAVEVATQQSVNSIMRMRSNIKKTPKKYTVYKHVFPDGKVYVGKTGQALRDRWKNGSGYNGTLVGEAIDIYGWENVRHYILFESSDKQLVDKVEAALIHTYRSNYNKYGYNGSTPSIDYDENADMSAVTNIEVDGYGSVSC